MYITMFLTVQNNFLSTSTPILGRWVAKLLGDGLLSRQRDCLPQQLFGFESRHLSEIQNGRHKQRSGHTLARKN